MTFRVSPNVFGLQRGRQASAASPGSLRRVETKTEAIIWFNRDIYSGLPEKAAPMGRLPL